MMAGTVLWCICVSSPCQSPPWLSPPEACSLQSDKISNARKKQNIEMCQDERNIIN